jgi:uncharacterized protein (DUF488 family)
MPVALKRSVYTIGYGGRTIDDVVALITKHRVAAIADVRTTPYSNRYPAFAREQLQQTLQTLRVSYVFLGEELGARPSDPAMYDKGRVSYRLLRSSSAFRSGIARISGGSESLQIALLCAEKDPLACHRAILIAPALVREGLQVLHIGANGGVESQADLERRLLALYGLDQVPLFSHSDDGRALDEAYSRRSAELAYDVEAAYRTRYSK